MSESATDPVEERKGPPRWLLVLFACPMLLCLAYGVFRGSTTAYSKHTLKQDRERRDRLDHETSVFSQRWTAALEAQHELSEDPDPERLRAYLYARQAAVRKLEELSSLEDKRRYSLRFGGDPEWEELLSAHLDELEYRKLSIDEYRDWTALVYGEAPRTKAQAALLKGQAEWIASLKSEVLDDVLDPERVDKVYEFKVVEGWSGDDAGR